MQCGLFTANIAPNTEAYHTSSRQIQKDFCNLFLKLYTVIFSWNVIFITVCQRGSRRNYVYTGSFDGLYEGCLVGLCVGFFVGLFVGALVGCFVGMSDGDRVGENEGLIVGEYVGETVGEKEGDKVC